MTKKKKRRKLKLKRFFLTMVLLGLLFSVGFLIATMPVKNIYVKGNNYVSEDEIISASGIDLESSFLLINSKNIIKKIKKNEFIKKVKIYKKIGNKLILSVNEYKILCLDNDNNLVLENGKVLENKYNLTDIPVMINIIDNKDVKKNFLKKFSLINSNILRQISQIEYSPVDVDADRFILYMDDGNEVIITLTKIQKLNKYNNIVEKMDGNFGIIYLDSGNYIELKEKIQKIEPNNNSNLNNEE